MVTCKNCGHEYQSKVLQTPQIKTLRSELVKISWRTVHNAIRFQVMMDQTFIGSNLLSQLKTYYVFTLT